MIDVSWGTLPHDLISNENSDIIVWRKNIIINKLNENQHLNWQIIVCIDHIYMFTFSLWLSSVFLHTSVSTFPPPPVSSSWSACWPTWRPAGGQVPSGHCRPESPTAARCNWADPAGWRSVGEEGRGGSGVNISVLSSLLEAVCYLTLEYLLLHHSLTATTLSRVQVLQTLRLGISGCLTFHQPQ